MDRILEVRACSDLIESFDRDYFVSWQGALLARCGLHRAARRAYPNELPWPIKWSYKIGICSSGGDARAAMTKLENAGRSDYSGLV